MRHLLSHQSGIRHYGGPNEHAELYNTIHYDDTADALEVFENAGLVRAPGAPPTIRSMATRNRFMAAAPGRRRHSCPRAASRWRS